MQKRKKCRPLISLKIGYPWVPQISLAYHVPQWNCCFRGILKISYFQTHPDKANVSKFPDTKTWQFQHWKFSCRPNVRCVPMTVKENLHERRISNEHGWTNRTNIHILEYMCMYIICIWLEKQTPLYFILFDILADYKPQANWEPN